MRLGKTDKLNMTLIVLTGLLNSKPTNHTENWFHICNILTLIFFLYYIEFILTDYGEIIH